MLTNLTPSRAARARISAHETVPLQQFSTLDLIASITSKPLIELLALDFAVLSPIKVGVSAKSTEPSQPYCKSTQPLYELIKYL